MKLRYSYFLRFIFTYKYIFAKEYVEIYKKILGYNRQIKRISAQKIGELKQLGLYRKVRLWRFKPSHSLIYLQKASP